MTDEQILTAAQQIVLDALRGAPDGLTNAEVGYKTAPYLEVPNHTGYISWTILNHLVLARQAVKGGKVYRLRSTCSH